MEVLVLLLSQLPLLDRLPNSHLLFLWEGLLLDYFLEVSLGVRTKKHPDADLHLVLVLGHMREEALLGRVHLVRGRCDVAVGKCTGIAKLNSCRLDYFCVRLVHLRNNSFRILLGFVRLRGQVWLRESAGLLLLAFFVHGLLLQHLHLERRVF